MSCFALEYINLLLLYRHDVDDVTKDDFYRNPDLTSVLVSTHLLSEAQLQAKEAEVKSFVLALAAGLKAEEE